ncbi:MFS transporter [Phosphitispora fastidiosa]|uniref:MFS transporter n=1 Tax=Phosphitispora fastidiosa TaxID=2837202 RepID=UPI001E5FFDC4|nr:MFS transporter [Phosphitispora fastidiosa]MBU7008661.1 sugar phosphate permease [Phosphitispora fastidiosa]
MTKKSFSFVHYGWVVLIMGTFAIFGALGLARFGYSVILPNMQAGLGMDNAQIGLLATMGLVGYLVLAIIGGALASRYGVRIVASTGLALAGAGMLFMGLSNTYLMAAFWSGLSGLGSGAVNIAIMGLWPAWFSRKKRGLASGIAVSGSSLGLIITGFVVPRIISVYGENAWQISWLVFGSITLLLAVGSFLIIRNNPGEMGLKPIGDDEVIPNVLRNDNVNWRDVYFSPAVWSLGIVYIAFGFSYIVFMTFFVKHLVADAGLAETTAGRLYMLMGWFSLASGIIWGMLSDKIGRNKTLVILYLIHGLAFSLFAIGKSPIHFTITAMLYGISAWSIPAIMSAACGDLLGPKLAPAALGFITLFFGIGQVLGPVVAGIIADAYGSFSPVFLLTAAAAFLGALSSAFIVKSAANYLTTD